MSENVKSLVAELESQFTIYDHAADEITSADDTAQGNAQRAAAIRVRQQTAMIIAHFTRDLIAEIKAEEA